MPTSRGRSSEDVHHRASSKARDDPPSHFGLRRGLDEALAESDARAAVILRNASAPDKCNTSVQYLCIMTTPHSQTICVHPLRRCAQRASTRHALDGSGEKTTLLESVHDQFPTPWSADGRLIAYTEHHPETESGFSRRRHRPVWARNGAELFYRYNTK